MRASRAASRGGLLCLGILALLLQTLGGCHSGFVETTIDNRGSKSLRLIEVDYPSASFGVGELAANSQFHYHFKVQGSGAVRIQFTDAGGKVSDSEGPMLKQGQEGHLTIAIDSTGRVDWEQTPASPK